MDSIETETPDEVLLRAEKLEAEGHYQQAYELYRPLAESGSARAQVYLGVLHFSGVLGAIDLAAAERWYRAASDQGDYSGSLNLGTLCLSRPERTETDIREARRWYELALRQGCSYVPSLGWLEKQDDGITND